MSVMPSDEIKVFISSRESVCNECKEELGKGAWITLQEGKGALCLACSDLDHLFFLPTGDAALTRRAKKYSTLWAVVLKWSKARKQYERQGLIVTEESLDRAEQECLADADMRERRREREAEKRTGLDAAYEQRFALEVRKLYPSAPPTREFEIALHACRKYSGRVGRSASAKNLEKEAVAAAVIAHIRHRETNYDQLLLNGNDRQEARFLVRGQVDEVLAKWSK